MENKKDIVVIGAGVIGICTALSLQKSGRNVTLISRLEKSPPASYGNAGHIACEQITPIASLDILKKLPFLLSNPLSPVKIDYKYLPKITPWLVKFLNSLRKKNYQHISIALQKINSHSLTAWKTLLAEEKLSYLLQINGSYLVAETQESLNLLKNKIHEFEQEDVEAHFIDQHQLLTQQPILNQKQLGGIFFPQTAHTVNPQTLCELLKKQLIGKGGKLVLEEVTDITETQENVTIQLKRNKAIIANQAVIACGVFSKQLVKQVSKVTPPLIAERGYHIMTNYTPSQINCPITSIDRRFIMTPMNSGLRLAGTVEYAPINAKPNYQRANNLLQLANGMIKTPLTAQKNSHWMGLRPTLPDSLPVIDKQGRIGYAFGHQHLGLTQAAITAASMRQLMNNQKTNIDLSAYRLSRFN